MTSLKGGNGSSILCNTIIGINVGWDCILICMLTLCSSLMTVFLWMWFTRILVIWIQNLWQDVLHMEFLPLSWRKSYLLSFQLIILYGKLYFYFYRDKGKINCAFSCTVTSTVWPEKISSPTSIIVEVKSVCLKY